MNSVLSANHNAKFIKTPTTAAVIALNAPFCGTKPTVVDDLLEPHLQSFAFIPLFKEFAKTKDIKHIFGVLILSAEEQHRFKTNMGTMYLERIGSLVSAAVVNYL